MDVHGIPGNPELAQQGRGQLGQRVEGIGELPGRRRARKAEAQMVGSDHVIPIGQQPDEIAEHERAGGEAVQQHEGRSVTRARFPVEQPLAGNVSVPVVNCVHF
jgi:hypothetical protein